MHQRFTIPLGTLIVCEGKKRRGTLKLRSIYGVREWSLSITSIAFGSQRPTPFPQPEQDQGLVFWWGDRYEEDVGKVPR